MKKITILILCIFAIFIALPVFAENDLGKKMSEVLMKAPEDGGWQVMSDEVYMWMKIKKMDFVVIDTKPDQDEYKAGHIPGAIYIPYNEIFKPENLRKLPKDKKIILVCHMGVTESLLIIPLRLLGYDAYDMLLGMSGWQKDYPAAEYVRGLIDATKERNYPLEKGE